MSGDFAYIASVLRWQASVTLFFNILVFFFIIFVAVFICVLIPRGLLKALREITYPESGIGHSLFRALFS